MRFDRNLCPKNESKCFSSEKKADSCCKRHLFFEIYRLQVNSRSRLNLFKFTQMIVIFQCSRIISAHGIVQNSIAEAISNIAHLKDKVF